MPGGFEFESNLFGNQLGRSMVGKLVCKLVSWNVLCVKRLARDSRGDEEAVLMAASWRLSGKAGPLDHCG